MKRLAAVLAPAALAAMLSACTPVEVPAGPEVTAPALYDLALVAPDGAHLPLRSWRPPGRAPCAAVVALHGFNDYSNFFDQPGRFLADHGIIAYAYDQRGFGGAPNRGLWAGSDALAADVRAALGLVRRDHPGVPLYLLGESMGGAVAMATLARPDAPTVDGLILVAPAVWGRNSMPWYQTTALWLAVHTFPARELTGRNLGIMPSNNIEMLRAFSRDPMVIKNTRVDAIWGLVNLMDEAMLAAPRLDGRTLVLYGEHDQLIPRGAIDEMLTRLPEGSRERRRFVLYPGGYHMLTRDLDAETVWRHIADWIGEPGECGLPPQRQAWR